MYVPEAALPYLKSDKGVAFTSEIFDTERHARIIQESHDRSCKLGIDPNQQAAPMNQALTAEQLQQRIQDNQQYYDLITTRMSLLYQILEGSGFCMGATDAQGYVLHILGDPVSVAHYRQTNCVPGFRWTEEDVGTCAIGLTLKLGIPLQISGEEIYCNRGHNMTNSAAPIFDHTGELLGVIVLSGMSEQVHAHTLGLAILAAQAIRLQYSELAKAQATVLHNKFMTELMESDHRGIVALNKTGAIVQLTRKASALLGIPGKTASTFAYDEPHLCTLDSLTHSEINWAELIRSRQGLPECEIEFKRGKTTISLICSLDPVKTKTGECIGGMLLLMEQKRVMRLANEIAGSQARFTFESILGTSPALQTAKELAMTTADSTMSVLLTGETGTGKELFAQAIHNASPRRDKAFVAVNCGAIPRELLESELFGYVGGAFTGARKGGRPGKLELAEGGTLFLDEIGDMPTDMQVKLLRVLQSGEICRIGGTHSRLIDLRIIAATNTDIHQAIERKVFRQDLYYRISTLKIEIPPLRRRGNDVLILAEFFLQRIRERLGKPAMTLSTQAQQLLTHQPWPGNIRQLENTIERAANIAESSFVLPDDLGLASDIFPESTTPPSLPADSARQEPLLHITGTLKEIEYTAIMQQMHTMQGNISKVARNLGISRPTLYRKLQQYKLPVPPRS